MQPRSVLTFRSDTLQKESQICAQTQKSSCSATARLLKAHLQRRGVRTVAKRFSSGKLIENATCPFYPMILMCFKLKLLNRENRTAFYVSSRSYYQISITRTLFAKFNFVDFEINLG